jgi:hypothetical protein
MTSTDFQIFGKTIPELRRILLYHEMTGVQQFEELQHQQRLIQTLQDSIRQLAEERDDLAAALADRFPR